MMSSESQVNSSRSFDRKQKYNKTIPSNVIELLVEEEEELTKHCRQSLLTVEPTRSGSQADEMFDVPVAELDCQPGTVNGQAAQALWDTGCGSLLVHKRLVHKDDYTGIKRKVRMADRSIRDVNLDVVDLDSSFLLAVLEFWLWKILPMTWL